MWGWAMGRAPLLLLLLLPGAVGLRCLSCGGGDGGCSEATPITCPPESDVCTEALASVTWSHGRLALGGRGCGRGQPGSLARALEVAGVVVFVRRRQCRGRGPEEEEEEERGGACNGVLPMGTEEALPVAANVTAQAPNGLRCFGCPEAGPCSAPTVVHCYGEQRGCFHGNVTVSLGGSRLWRELRGCARAPSCPIEPHGAGAVGLEGACCGGDLCNGDTAARGLFAPDRPRLQLLPLPARANGSSKAGESAKANMAAPVGDASDAKANVAAPTGSTEVTVSNMAASIGNMAASIGNMAATASNMAASRGNGSEAHGPVGRMEVTVSNMAASVGNGSDAKGKMAAPMGNLVPTAANMAATKANMAAPVGDLAPTAANMAATQSNMAASIGSVAPPESKMAATTGKMAAAMDAPTAAAMDSKMAAGRAGRPLEHQIGAKGPVGRSQALGAGLWPLPFLLLRLL